MKAVKLHFSFSFFHLQQIKREWGKKLISNKKKFDQTQYSFHTSLIFPLHPPTKPALVGPLQIVKC